MIEYIHNRGSRTRQNGSHQYEEGDGGIAKELDGKYLEYNEGRVPFG